MITSLTEILEHSLQKHMVRKHYYNFCYSANILNIRSRGFDCAQYCIAWYMMEYVNQNQKANSQHLMLIINSYKGEFKILSNILDGAFSVSCYWLQRISQNLVNYLREALCKSCQKLKPIQYFCKNSIFDVWQGSEYASELASKVKDVSFLN